MQGLLLLILGLAMPVPAPANPVPDSPPMPGTITVELANDRAEPPEKGEMFSDAVEDALLEARFLTLPATSHSRYLARVTVIRSTRGLATSRTSIAGPETNVGNWGGSVKVTLPSRKTILRNFVQTRLRIDIVLRSTARPVWSGSASTVQVETAGMGTSPATASKLAEAVIRQFPGETGVSMSVP